MIRKKDSKCKYEVDAVNPTLLFQYIQEEDIGNAIARVKSHPEECKIWIVSRNRKTNETIMWRYLPLHLVCLLIQQMHHLWKNNDLQRNNKYLKLKQLVLTIVQAYPKCIAVKDFDGNLPIHIILQQAHKSSYISTSMDIRAKIDEELMNLLMDRKFKNYCAKDAFGISILDLYESHIRYGNQQGDRFSDDAFSFNNNTRTIESNQVDLFQWINNFEKLQQNHQSMQCRDDNAEGCFHPKQKRQVFSNVHHKDPEIMDTIISSLQLDCLSKSEKIDTLSSEVEFLRSRMKSLKENVQHTKAVKKDPQNGEASTGDFSSSSTSSTIQTSQSEFDQFPKERQCLSPSYEELKAENSALHKKIELDSSIFASQEETIESLKHQIKVLNVEKESSEMKTEQMEKQLNQMKNELTTNNDSIEHLRQITNILQKDLEAKDDEIKRLKSIVAESKQREQILESSLQQKDKEIERNVCTLQSDLREQSDVIKKFINSLDGLSTNHLESVNNGDRDDLIVEFVKKDVVITKSNESMSGSNHYDNEDGDPAHQSGRVELDEMSPKSSYDDPNDGTSDDTNAYDDDDDKCFSDIRERQNRLRQDLKHIYNQIKTLVPHKPLVENNDENSGDKKQKDDDNFHHQVTPKQRHRPWHKELNTDASPRTKATAAELGEKILDRNI